MINRYSFYALFLIGCCSPICGALAMQDPTAADTIRQLDEVEILRSKQDVRRNRLGVQQLNLSDMSLAPRLLGEIDPIKSLRTLPGFGNGGDGNAGLYVRGSEPGHNLIRLNGMTIFNPNHLLGIFSVFNPNTVQEMTVNFGAPTADYFGRLSSYIDLQSNWRPPDSTHAVAALGLIYANAGIKTAVSDRMWIDVQARKTFLNQTLWPLLKRLTPNDKTLSRTAYDLYDLNANAALSLKSGVLSWSVYHGGDDFGFSLTNDGIDQYMHWKNTAMRIQLDQQSGQAFKSSYLISYSHYGFGFGLDDGTSFISLSNRICAMQGTAKWAYSHSKWRIMAGVHGSVYGIHPLEPGVNNNGLSLDTRSLGRQQAYETQGYVDVLVEMTPRLTARAGLSYTYFVGINRSSESGPNKYGYHNPDPTVNISYQLTPVWRLAASWNRSHQTLHFLPLTSSSLPADFWISSDMDIAPSTARQAAMGLFGRWLSAGYEARIEVYSRTMDNVYEYSGQLLNLVDETGIADKLLTGRGQSYGVECFIKKTDGRLNGYVSYAYARSFRRFAAIDYNNRYPFKYDRPNQLNTVLQYKVNKRWTANMHFTYGDGSTFTPEVGRYFLGNSVVSEYGPYNSARLPAYHRLDLGATYLVSKTGRLKQEINFNVINVYNRRNSLFQYYEFNGSLDADRPHIATEEAHFAILPILPSVTYTITL